MEPFEPPKYLASLIAAINDGAKSAQLGALAFTAIGVFLLATSFSATDEDLLLNHAVTISQLGGVSVPVAFAFGLAPAVFVATHFYTLMRYDMLGGNLRLFRDELAATVPVAAHRERCRQLLANVEFVNALAMPRGSAAASWLFRAAVVALLAVFPVLVLLLVHIGALRLQSEVVNDVHHVALAADLLLLVWYFFRQDGGRAREFWRAPWQRKLRLCWLPALVLGMDVAWLNVPSPEAGATIGSDIVTYAGEYYRDENLLNPWADLRFVLQIQPVDQVLCPFLTSGWGCRYLTLTSRPLVAKVWDARTFVELRGGDLDDRHRKSVEVASLGGRVLRFANLSNSELVGADLNSAKLQGANLTDAQLQDADLRGAQLQGAVLFGARLQGASLWSAQLQGAILWSAQLQGASLWSAQLQGAYLRGAQLQGAYLSGAQLQGAELIGTQLQGAYLSGAQLQGADLTGAQLQGATLFSARLWNAVTDNGTQLGLADMRRVQFDAGLGEGDIAKMRAGIPEPGRSRVRQALVPRADSEVLPAVGTEGGPALVDSPTPAGLHNFSEAQVTHDVGEYEAKLGRYLAEQVAPIAPQVAEQLARAGMTSLMDRFDKREAFICPLLASASAGKVTLSQHTIKRMKDSLGKCP